jgi:hypothetical protein
VYLSGRRYSSEVGKAAFETVAGNCLIEARGNGEYRTKTDGKVYLLARGDRACAKQSPSIGGEDAEPRLGLSTLKRNFDEIDSLRPCGQGKLSRSLHTEASKDCHSRSLGKSAIEESITFLC